MIRIRFAAPLLTMLLPLTVLPPAGAAERHWVFTSSCSAADWFGPPSGTPASCWAATAGGAAGASLPGLADDARIVLAGATATQRVPFAGAARGSPAVAVRSLLLQGSASFAAGLTLDRGSLDLGELALGQTGQAGRGLLELGGGEVTAKQTRLRAGDVVLAAGTLRAGELELASQGSAARLSIGGGRLEATTVALGSAQGQAAAIDQQGGSMLAQSLTLGAFKGQTPAGWTVAGTGTSATVVGALAVGGSGSGRMVVQPGAQVAAGSVVVGQAPEIAGELALVGNGRLETSSLTVGGHGSGQLTLGDGGRLFTGDLVLGDAAGAEGRVTVTGTPAALKVDRYVIGRAGRGHMELSGDSPSLVNAMYGAALEVGTLAGADGTLLLDGTSLWIPFGTSVVGDQGTGWIQVSGGRLEMDTLAIGRGANGRGRVTLRGAAGGVHSFSALDIGHAGRGTLELLDGAVINDSELVATLGAATGGRGEILVDGAGSGLTLATLAAGGGGAHRVSVTGGGLLNARTLTLGPASRLLLDGGLVRTRFPTLGQDGVLDWRNGTLQLDATVAMDGLQLPRRLDLTAGRTLRAGSSLIAGDGATLVLDGGALSARTLDLRAGARLEAQGTVQAAVLGAAGSWIQATGPLVLGDAFRADGVQLAGVLWAGGQAVELRSAGAALLGLQTRLTDGGSLTAGQGLWLPASGALVGEGQASVFGALRNDGTVAAISGRLSFQGLASGEGSWAGDLRFDGGFDPGDGAVERVFAGGSIEIGPAGWLQLDIVDTQPRLGHDQLSEIGTLTLDGALRLVFAPGFATETAVRLQLLSFQHFAGVLDASDVEVLGLPAWRVDWSSLPVDGSITIAAVPEPATAWLLLAGGALLARRRRQMSSANSPVCVGGRSKP